MSKKKHQHARERAEAARAARKSSRDARARAPTFTIPRRVDRPLWDVVEGVVLRGAHPPMELVGLRQAWFTADEVRRAQFRQLVVAVSATAPRLAVPEALAALWHVARVAWVRDPTTYIPRGKARGTQLRALIAHTAAQYPVPVFLYAAFEGWADNPWVPLFAHLATGGSLRHAVRRGLLPVPLSRRGAHLFLGTTASVPIVDGLRRAQVAAHGGDVRIARAAGASRLGRELQPEEVFWDTVLAWLARQVMLDPHQVGPLLDYVAHRREGAPDFSIVGRSAAAVLRAMTAWHAELQQLRRVTGDGLPRSGIDGGRWEFKRGRGVDVWSIQEIRSVKELAAEGRAQRHCVLSYRPRVASGAVSIWSMTYNGARVLTLEVVHRGRTIVQARGAMNRPATAVERGILNRWAAAAQLGVGRM